MNHQEIMKKLEEIFRDLLDEEEFVLSEELTKEDLEEWDSLFHITLIATISDEFGIEFTTDDILAATDVPAILKILDRFGLEK